MPFPTVFEKLQAARARVINAKKTKDFLQEVSLQPDTNFASQPDDSDSLIDDIIQMAFKAGTTKVISSTVLARAQLTVNSLAQAERLTPMIEEIRQDGSKSLRAIACVLNTRGIVTKNGNKWDSSSVRFLLQRIEEINHKEATSEMVTPTSQEVESVPAQAILEKLKAAKERVSEASRSKDFLQEALLQPNADFAFQPDDADSLINDLIQTSYEAAPAQVIYYTDLARAKSTANSLDQAKRLTPVVEEIRHGGAKSLREIASFLNTRGILTKNGNEWNASTVSLLLQKIEEVKQRDDSNRGNAR